MKVGILGFGRLGGLVTHYLAQDFDVHVFDHIDRSSSVKEMGASWSPFETVAKCELVLLCVPVAKIQNVFKDLAPLVCKNQVIVDTCAVKSYPLELAKQHLPSGVHYLGTHPMFGPDSASDTLFGNKIVLCSDLITEEKLAPLRTYLKRYGLKVIECSADQHDQEISHSLFLPHLLGQGLIEFGATPKEIDTKGYRRMMKILLTVQNDSWELFHDMYHYNPHAKQTFERYLNSAEAVKKRLLL